MSDMFIIILTVVGLVLNCWIWYRTGKKYGITQERERCLNIIKYFLYLRYIHYMDVYKKIKKDKKIKTNLN